MNLAQKVVVITGGSRGIGKALAAACVAQHATVIVIGHNAAELQASAAEIGAEAVVADVTDFAALERAAQDIAKQYTGIDLWINNAGIQIAPTPAEDVSIEKLQQLFAVNFFGYFYGCKAVLPIMKQQGSGVIVTINSTAGLSGKPGLSAYCASKFAVKGMSEAIRAELADSGVKLYEVFPGGVQTDIYHEQVPADFTEYMPVAHVVDKVMANLTAAGPEPDLIIRRPSASTV